MSSHTVVIAIHIVQRARQRIVGGLGNLPLADPVAQGPSGAQQAHADRSGAGLEDLGECGGIEVVPVVEL